MRARHDRSGIIANLGPGPISLMKIDIEGAEAGLFGSESLDRIDEVETVVIELHDDTSFGPASRIFHEAVKDRGFEISTSGELTVCTRSRR